jgi:UDP-N-acetylmuramoyl-tripeptide--D-alanyl-D-alanine ligase
MHTAQSEPDCQRWVILGDILELGDYSHEEHLLTGTALVPLVDRIVAIGAEARFYVEGALAAGMPAEHAHYFAANLDDTAALEAAKQAAATLLKAQVKPHDLVLLKASLGVGMDTLLQMLQS